MSRMSRLNSTLFREPAVGIWNAPYAASYACCCILSDGCVIVTRSSDTLKYNKDMTVAFVLTDYQSRTRYVQDSAGNIYFGNPSGVHKFNGITGELITSFTDFTNLRGVAVDSSGNIVLARNSVSGEKSLVFMNSSGVEQWSKTHDDGYTSASDVTMDSQGNVIFVRYSTSGNTLSKFDPDGNVIWETNELYLTTVVCDSEDNIITQGGVSYSYLRKRNSSGTSLYPGRVHGIPYTGYGIVNVDKNGYVYAIDQSSYTNQFGFYKYTPELLLMYRLKTYPGHHNTWCSDGEGLCYTTNATSNVDSFIQWREY